MRVAFFPYDKTMRYMLKHISKRYHIQKLVSPIGWGYVGESVDTNRGELIVEKEFGTENDVDCMGIVNSIFPLDFETMILPYLEICKRNHIKVMWFRECSKDIRKRVEEIISPKNLLWFSKEDNNDREQLQSLYEIHTLIIYVADVFPNQKSSYMQLKVYDEIKKRGYSAKLIGSEAEYNMIEGVLAVRKYNLEIGMSRYILGFNHLLKKIEMYEKPDVFIIGIPGNILEISKKIHGNFGEYFWGISKVAMPDYVICNMPYCVNINERCMEIKESVEKNTGIEVDALVVIPQYLDLMLSEETQRFEYVSLSEEFLTSKIIDKKILYGSYDKEVYRLIDGVIEKLSSYAFNDSQ